MPFRRATSSLRSPGSVRRGPTIASCGNGALVVLSGRRTAAAPLRRRLRAARARSYSSPAEKAPPAALATSTNFRPDHERSWPIFSCHSVPFLSKLHCPGAIRHYLSPMQLPLFGRQTQTELARTAHGGDLRRGLRKL